jgi:hypothetical protein
VTPLGPDDYMERRLSAVRPDARLWSYVFPTDKIFPAAICELGNGVMFKVDDEVLSTGLIFERQRIRKAVSLILPVMTAHLSQTNTRPST